MTDISAGTMTERTASGSSPLIASDKVAGAPVRRPDGEKLGAIERLMIDKVSGRVAYAVMAFGGVLGLGEDHTVLPWSALAYDPALDAYRLDLTDEQLKSAPRRTPSGGDPALDRAWEDHLHRHYEATPYWFS